MPITPASTSSEMPLICAERISARPSPNVKMPAGRARGEPRGDERERQRGGVGEHVRGVGEQRQRAREDARDHLGDHEREDQRERGTEPAVVRIGGHRVVMMLMMLVRIGF